MAKIEAECLQCKGEGDVIDLFGDTRLCTNCKGAGVVMVSQRKFSRPPRETGYVITREIEKPVDNDKDKIVLIVFEGDRDVSHLFCGTEEWANETKLSRESQGCLVEQYTPNEYYKIFNSVYKPRYNVK